MHWRPAAKPLIPERTRTMTTSTISIDGRRLWQSLMDLAQIGATPKGGNCRLALTALDGQGRDLVVGWMKEAGLSVRVDQVGNIFARRAGRDDARPPVMPGSHIPTQPTGGARTSDVKGRGVTSREALG